MSKANSTGRRRLPTAVLPRLKKGVLCRFDQTRKGLRSGWWWQTARVFLWETTWDSASPAEVGLIEPTLERVAVPRPGRGRPRKNPTRLIYDKAADSDPLRTRLARRGIELICPHRKKPEETTHPRSTPLASLQETMESRTYLRMVGAIFDGWSCGWEYHIQMYQAFVNVACMMIILRRL